MKLHLTLFVFLTVLECVCASGYFRNSSFEHFREFLGVETETDNRGCFTFENHKFFGLSETGGNRKYVSDILRTGN